MKHWPDAALRTSIAEQRELVPVFENYQKSMVFLRPPYINTYLEVGMKLLAERGSLTTVYCRHNDNVLSIWRTLVLH